MVTLGGFSTVRVKFCVAFGKTPLRAVMMMGYVAAVPAAGVPLSTPVVGLSETALGNVPLSLNVDAGKPEAVTVKEVPATLAAKVLLLALVIVGAWSTASGALVPVFVEPVAVMV